LKSVLLSGSVIFSGETAKQVAQVFRPLGLRFECVKYSFLVGHAPEAGKSGAPGLRTLNGLCAGVPTGNGPPDKVSSFELLELSARSPSRLDPSDDVLPPLQVVTEIVLTHVVVRTGQIIFLDGLILAVVELTFKIDHVDMPVCVVNRLEMEVLSPLREG
jgi:hypothetical protein